MSSTKYIDVGNTLENLERAVAEENYRAVRRFVDHCAAEGVGESQQARLTWSWKTLLEKFAPEEFEVADASEEDLKELMAEVNRSDYADSTKVKFKTAVKKLYRTRTDGTGQAAKTKFFKIGRETSSVSRDDLFTDEEIRRLLRSFHSTRDRAFALMLYESAARPGELQSRNIADFTSNEKGDFIHLEGLKGTPDRTNQLVRSGQVVREWLMQHPFGGELGNIDDPSAPLWVKSEQQACERCGEIPRNHDAAHEYDPDERDRMTYQSFYRRFKQACKDADIPDNKTRPYNLRHTRLTEVATFMGYEQLNKFAGWTPGSDRAKVYVHLNNDDVNKAIRDQYGLSSGEDESRTRSCPFCDAENQVQHSECRNCGRPMDLESKTKQKEKREVLERLSELEEQGVLDELERLQK